MRYHICKQSRLYDGEPYSGYSCSAIGKDLAESDTLEEALEFSRKLTEFNPVGWNVFDSFTGKLVDGIDFFK